MCNARGMDTDGLVADLRDLIASRAPAASAEHIDGAGRIAVTHHDPRFTRIQNVAAIRDAIYETYGFPCRAARLRPIVACVDHLNAALATT